LSLAGGDQAAVIAVGAGVLLAAGGGIFKAVNLRGDSNSKWSSRIDLAAGALDEKTIAELHGLRSEIDDLLPEAGMPFDPAQAIVDPSPLSARVEQTAKYYRARVRMQKDLGRVLKLGRVLVLGLALFAIGVVLLTIYFAELLSWDWPRFAGFGFSAVGLATLLVAMCGYGFCVDRLAGAEILADTASQAEGKESG
jgi:hypothetical protein